jgi:UDP-N-acetylglucosamine--N-acetylmuramyl-(pentapeptide) pyrophosphoryl-undecaprenol N-acetylglucosamine transferase
LARILYGVSPIGFGHASRAAAVGLELRENSHEPEFATGGPAVDFLRSYGFTVHDVVSEPVPSERNGEMKSATTWYLRYWMGYRSTRRRMADLLKSAKPALVVGDEEFSSVSLALEAGIEQVLIADELNLGFARGAISRRVEKRVGEWYLGLQRRVAHLLVPSFGKDEGNTHYVTPIVRPVTKAREDVRKELSVPEAARVVLFSSSGSGIGAFLFKKTLGSFRKVCAGDDALLVAGSIGISHSRGVRELGVVRDNQNLVAASDLVVSTAGKSTIDEAASSGTPIIAIPIRNHAEQERNASELGLGPGDADRMEELMRERLGRRAEPRNYQGAAKTAEYLGSLL